MLEMGGDRFRTGISHTHSPFERTTRMETTLERTPVKMDTLIRVLSLLFATCFTLIASAQPRLQESIGGSASDEAKAMAATSDGGSILAGLTWSFGAGASDMYVVKLDADGAIEWTKTIGGEAHDVAFDVVQTLDGGYAVTGYTASYGAGGEDVYVVKLDASGNVQWSKAIGGTENDRAYSIVQNEDGSYVVAGSTLSFGIGNYNIYVLKLDATGQLLWNETLRGAGGAVGTSLVHCNEGGYALAVYCGTTATSSIDYGIIRLDANGAPVWWTTIGETAHDYAWSIIQTSDNGFAVTGYCQGFGAGASDVFVVKLSSFGAVQWTRTVGGSGSEMGRSIIQDSNGEYTIGGLTTSPGGTNTYIVHLDANGAYKWSKYTNDNLCNVLRTASNGGFAVAGMTTGGDVYFAKFNSSGSTCGTTRSMKSKFGTGGTVTSETPVVTNPIPTVSIPSPVESSGGSLVQMCSHRKEGVGPDHAESNQDDTPRTYTLDQNFPNPFNPSTVINYSLVEESTVMLKVYNILGMEVATLVNETQSAGGHSVTFNAQNMESGWYMYTIIASGQTLSRQMMLVK